MINSHCEYPCVFQPACVILCDFEVPSRFSVCFVFAVVFIGLYVVVVFGCGGSCCYQFVIFTSRVSGQGNRICPIRLSVCLFVQGSKLLGFRMSDFGAKEL